MQELLFDSLCSNMIVEERKRVFLKAKSKFLEFLKYFSIDEYDTMLLYLEEIILEYKSSSVRLFGYLASCDSRNVENQKAAFTRRDFDNHWNQNSDIIEICNSQTGAIEYIKGDEITIKYNQVNRVLPRYFRYVAFSNVKNELDIRKSKDESRTVTPYTHQHREYSNGLKLSEPTIHDCDCIDSLDKQHHSHFDQDDQEIDYTSKKLDKNDSIKATERCNTVTCDNSPVADVVKDNEKEDIVVKAGSENVTYSKLLQKGFAKPNCNVTIPKFNIVDYKALFRQKRKPKKFVHGEYGSRRLRESVRDQLECRFKKSPFIQGSEKGSLATQLNLTNKQVSSWFIERRRKERVKGKSINIGSFSTSRKSTSVSKSRPLLYNKATEVGERITNKQVENDQSHKKRKLTR